MTRTRRPTFSPTDVPSLLDALGEARKWAIKYGSAQPFHSPQRSKSDAVLNAIDGLAEELTGDRTHFHLRPHGGPR